MIRRQSVLVFICLGLALIANANARPHRRDVVELGALVTKVTGQLKTVEDLTKGLLATVGSVADDTISAPVLKLLNTILAKVAQLKSMEKTLTTSATIAVTAELHIISGTLDPIKTVLEKVASLASNLDDNADEIEKLLTGVVNVLTLLIAEVLSLVQKIVSALNAALTEIDGILSALQVLKTQAVGAALSDVLNTVSEVGNLKTQLLKTLTQLNVIKIASDLPDTLVDILGKAQDVVNKVANVKKLLGQGLSSIKAVLAAVQGIVPLVTRILDTLLELVGNLLNDLLSGALSGVLSGVLGGVLGNLNLVGKRAIY